MAQKNGKVYGLMTAMVAVFIVAMFGLNFVTGPLIAKNGNAQELAPLYSVMPDAAGFEKLYDVADAASATLVDVPETVQTIYAETSGKGYVVRMATTKGYTGNAIELTMAVDSEGKISGMDLNAYPETKDFGAEFPQTFVGQDSALADVVIVAGCTYSSVAFRDAVTDGFNALIANNLVGAGQKGADQILMELLATSHSGLVNNVAVGQYEESDGTGNIVKIMKARNNTGYAYLMKSGDSMVLAVVNATGNVKVIDVEGKDVTASCADLAAEAAAHAATGAPVSADKEKARLNALLPDAELIAVRRPRKHQQDEHGTGEPLHVPKERNGEQQDDPGRKQQVGDQPRDPGGIRRQEGVGQQQDQEGRKLVGLHGLRRTGGNIVRVVLFQIFVPGDRARG